MARVYEVSITRRYTFRVEDGDGADFETDVDADLIEQDGEDCGDGAVVEVLNVQSDDGEGPWVGGHAGPYPHKGGCRGCADEVRCNVCGAGLGTYSCTNGRCPRCHGDFCYHGGATSPGHGYGDLNAIRRAVLAGLNR